MPKISKLETQVVNQNLQIILIIWHINAEPKKVQWYPNGIKESNVLFKGGIPPLQPPSPPSGACQRKWLFQLNFSGWWKRRWWLRKLEFILREFRKVT